MNDRPEQRPEGAAIAAALRTSRMSQREAATRAGISEARWRHIVSGYRPEAGHRIPVRGPAETVARMARVVGITPEKLEEVGRHDAATELRTLSAMVADERPPTFEELAAEVAEQRRSNAETRRLLDEQRKRGDELERMLREVLTQEQGDSDEGDARDHGIA